MTFKGEEIEHAHSKVRRLRLWLSALAQLSSELRSTGLAEEVARCTIEHLGVRACVLLGTKTDGSFETLAVSHAPTVTSSWSERIALRLAGDVIASAEPLYISDLSSRHPYERSLNGAELSSFLAVAMRDLNGHVHGVAAVLGSQARELGEEDAWWLEVVARLFADASAYRAMRLKLTDLERALAPAKPGSVIACEEDEEERLSVLVIDDDPSVNELICEFLTDEGFRVQSAHDGLEAIRMFRPSEHDVVLTDVAMPLMNGWELVAALRVRAPELPIVLITGYSSGTWNKNYLKEQGVVEVLNKPLDLDKLLGLMQVFADQKITRDRDFAC